MFFGSPFGRHNMVNRTTNNDSLHNHTVATPSNTEVCLCKQALRRRKHWLLAQKISNCFDFTQAVCANNTLQCQNVCANNTLQCQNVCANNTLHCQNVCANTLRKLLARVGAALPLKLYYRKFLRGRLRISPYLYFHAV